MSGELPLTVTEAAAALRAGETTSVELTTTMFERADALDSQLGVYLARFDEYGARPPPRTPTRSSPPASTAARCRASRSASRTSSRPPRDRRPPRA